MIHTCLGCVLTRTNLFERRSIVNMSNEIIYQVSENKSASVENIALIAENKNEKNLESSNSLDNNENNKYLFLVSKDDSVSIRDEKIGQTGESCLSFFTDTWSRPYNYRVYITRGCFNLNALLFYNHIRDICSQSKSGDKKIESVELREKWKKTFMTQSALLSYVSKLNEDYNARNHFPKILIADELVIYGRQITAYRRQLGDAILQMRSEQPVQNGYSEWTIRDDLNKAIHIRPCAQGENPPLEKNLRLSIEKPWLRLSLSEQREYVQKISDMIAKSCEVENTSYAPFFRLGEKEYAKLSESLKENSWHKSEWTYHRLYAHIWQKSAFDSEKNVKLMWTFRVHFDYDKSGKKLGSVRIIPLAVFNGLSYSAIMNLCNQIAEHIQEWDMKSPDIFRHLIELLRNSVHMLRHVQLQFLSFLLSVISFFEETQRAGIAFSIRDGNANFTRPLNKNHDLDKISQNFGKQEDTYKALRFLCAKENIEYREQLKNILLPFLNQNLTPFTCDKWNPQKCVKNPDRYLRRAEKIAYRQEMRDAVRLSQMQKEGVVYNSQVKTDIYLTLEEYMDDMFRQFSGEIYTLEGCIGAVFMLMDQGSLSMVTRRSQDNVYIHLRSGEQSMFMKVRRLYRFIPALIEIESRSLRRGYNPSRQAGRFGRFLDQREPGQNLEEQFQDIASDLEKCGEQFDDWNIDLLFNMDFPQIANDVRGTPEWYEGEWESKVKDFSNKSDEDAYFHYEREKQDYYKSLASTFRLM